MLEGKHVNLRAMEKEELPLFSEWFSSPEFIGEYSPLRQMTKSEAEKMLETPNELKPFIIEKKDGSKIGFTARFYVLHPAGRQLEIGYALDPSERGKGYASEAAQLLVDYLFLSTDTTRIQAHTDPRNTASQKILEKTGFKKEGTIRKHLFIRGELRDSYLYSLLREEWKGPRVLTKAS